uniref:Carbohydrate kinase PfkB domain-containing protein n=1 Tax=Aegilops tauschii subsp. strangulata TaxID=200361 RepID=A0A453RGE2_AEGTS
DTVSIKKRKNDADAAAHPSTSDQFSFLSSSPPAPLPTSHGRLRLRPPAIQAPRARLRRRLRGLPRHRRLFPQPRRQDPQPRAQGRGRWQRRQRPHRSRSPGPQPKDYIQEASNDALGKSILKELQDDGVDTSYMTVADGGNSPFTYIIVDNQTKTRTCIHTPGYPPMKPEELTKENLFAALHGVEMVYFDVRLHETALLVAEEASQRKIPILVDAEKKREGLDDLLNFASYVVCSAKFPQAWTGASSTPVALVHMLLRLPNLKFVIVTRGEKGCLMLERSMTDASETEETDVEDLLESLEQKVDLSSSMAKCVAS